MIQIIGIMIGSYIIVRMLSFITRSGERKEETVVKVAAGIVFVLTLILMLGLLATGGTTPKY